MSPHKFVQPKSNTIYHIRNVDSGLYVERGISSVPQMRPENTTSKRQHVRTCSASSGKADTYVHSQWRFTLCDTPLPGTYRIENPYPGDNKPVVALSYDIGPPLHITTAEPIQGGTQYNTWIFQNGGAQENAT